MSRYRTNGRLDEALVEDGDAAFLGVDEREPVIVPPGFVCEGVNCTFRTGRIIPRKGILPITWLNGDGLTWPWNFPVSFEYPRPIAASCLAAAVFSDADDLEWVIVAANDANGYTKVFATRQGFKPFELDVPVGEAGVQLTESSFTQCFNRLIWFRGRQHAELELADVRDGFKAIVQADSETDSGYNPGAATHTLPIPNASTGLFLQNRLFVPHGRDLVAASDFLNYTRYAIPADFRINEGSADELVALYKLGAQSLVAFKDNSIHLVSNLVGDLADVTQEGITTEFGLVGPKAVVGAGKDVWFMSQRGITSIGQILDNKVQLSDRTWSDAIPKSWGRIAWRYADRVRATFWDGYLLFAVPLDQGAGSSGGVEYAGVNNAVLVFDTFLQAWAGVHTGPNVMVLDWLQFTANGKRRLGFLSNDGLIYGWGLTFDDRCRPGTDSDETSRVVFPISTKVVTRGYAFVPNDSSAEIRRASASTQKRFARVIPVLAWSNPSYSVTAVVDGVAEEDSAVVDGTKERTRWVRPFDRAPYNEENEDGAHGDEGREDYSVNCSRSAGPDGPAGKQILLGDGVNCEQLQEAPEAVRVNRGGRYVQVRIENEQGRMEVAAVRVEARAGRRRNGAGV